MWTLWVREFCSYKISGNIASGEMRFASENWKIASHWRIASVLCGFWLALAVTEMYMTLYIVHTFSELGRSKDFSHISHTNAFTPVWTFKCLIRLVCFRNPASHASHLNSGSFSCVFLWFNMLVSWVKDLSQTSQRCGFTSRCVFSWSFIISILQKNNTDEAHTFVILYVIAMGYGSTTGIPVQFHIWMITGRYTVDVSMFRAKSPPCKRYPMYKCWKKNSLAIKQTLAESCECPLVMHQI